MPEQRVCARGSYGDESRGDPLPCLRQNVRIRRIRSRGAVLVLLWTCLASASYNCIIELSAEGFATDPLGVISIATFVLCCPLAGWLADVYFGRYKVMHAGLWIMWIGSNVYVLMHIVQFEVSESEHVLNNSVRVLAKVAITIGYTAFFVNVVPFGMDQMLEASAEEISAFIHWFIFAFYAGRGIAELGNLFYSCSHLQTITAHMFQSLIPVVLLSLVLCCDFLLRSWLVIEPESRNPLKLLFRVLKFNATHKHPIRRSAFTHCEDERPSRIDLAKSKYGGPFTTEEVEDVKTFLRMLVVTITFCAVYLPGYLYLFSVSRLHSHFRGIQNISNCSINLLSLCYSPPTITVLGIPLYEFIIYPVIRKRIPSTLTRVGFGLVLTLAHSFIPLTADIVGHIKDPSVPCIFKSNETATLQIEYMWVDVPSNILIAVTFIIFDVAINEFICAQAPYNLRGLLIGLSYSVSLTAFPVAYGIYKIWEIGLNTKLTMTPSCGFWYYLFIMLTAAFSLAIVCTVSRWYKRRERDEPENERMFVEDYYERYISQTDVNHVIQ